MAIPIRQEPEYQELYTRDHGVVKVVQSWQDNNYHIVKTPGGAYMHSNGLPVKNENELRAAFGTNTEELNHAIEWFRNRHEHEENPPRPIGFNSDGVPVFADGSVVDFDDLYAFFKPGPILTAAICALQEYQKGVARKPLKPVPPPSSPEQVAPDLPPAPVEAKGKGKGKGKDKGKGGKKGGNKGKGKDK